MRTNFVLVPGKTQQRSLYLSLSSAAYRAYRALRAAAESLWMRGMFQFAMETGEVNLKALPFLVLFALWSGLEKGLEIA